MKDMIEKLRNEKAESVRIYRQKGREDGFKFFRQATYEQLQYLAYRYLPTPSRIDVFGKYDPIDDPLLGGYFSAQFGEQQAFAVIQTQGPIKPNHLFVAWEEGWITAIREAWNKVKDQL